MVHTVLAEVEGMEDHRFDNWLRENLRNPRFKGDSWVYFSDYLDGIEPSTRVYYVRYLARFLEWLDYDTEQLYNEYKAMVDDPDPRTNKKMGIRVTKFQKKLMNEGLKEFTTLRAVNAIKQFFKSNELTLTLNGNQLKGRDREEIPNITKPQLKQVLGRCGSFRMKAVILFARDSGLRISDVTLLKIGDIKQIWDNPYYEQVSGSPGYFTFTVIQKKTGKPADPVVGPEAIQALHLWKVDRLKRGLTDNDDDPVFPTIRSRKGFIDKNGREVRENPKGGFADLATYSSIFSRYVRESNIQLAPGETKKPSIHSLRKHHKTTLEFSGVPTSWINKFQGRTGDGSGQRYTRPNPRQLIEMYARGYDELRIEGYGVSAEYQELKDRINELEKLYSIYSTTEPVLGVELDQEQHAKDTKKVFGKLRREL